MPSMGVVCETSGVSRYDQIVLGNIERCVDIEYIYKKNSSSTLLVCAGTHNSKGAFPSLVSLFDDHGHGMDLLFISEKENTYYQRHDGGEGYWNLILDVSKAYCPENIVFFGSSMAGYCAIRWAIALGASAVVSNPQIDLEVSAKYAWPELQNSIKRSGPAPSLSSAKIERACTVVSLWAKHPMDVVNFGLFMGMVAANTNLIASIDQGDSLEHKYMIRSYPHFMSLVRRALDMRRNAVI